MKHGQSRDILHAAPAQDTELASLNSTSSTLRGWHGTTSESGKTTTFHMSCHSESSVSGGYCYFIWTPSNLIAAHPQYGKGPAWVAATLEECGEGRRTKRCGGGMKSLPKALQVDSVMTRKLHPLLQLIKLIPSATANTEPFRVWSILLVLMKTNHQN